MSTVKANIINLESNTPALEVLFNPTELTVAKSNRWVQRENQGKNVPVFDFGGGDAGTIQMELFFDTHEFSHGGGVGRRKGRDVTVYTRKLWDLMMVDDKLKDEKNKTGRPPRVKFAWGPQNWFKAVLTSLSVRYTLFNEDGTPVRAVANVTFQQIEDQAKQPGTNPTSQSEPGHRRREVRPQDSLALIAYEEYGDPTVWRRIADANELEDPMRLSPGQILAIPPAA